LLFEGTAGDDVAVYALELGRSLTMRVTVSGGASRRPAPISSDLVVVERTIDTGPTRLWLVDRREVRERELDLTDEAPGTPPETRVHRQPSVCRSKSGKVRIAYARLVDPGGGEPPRFDVCVARVRGLVLENRAGAGPAAPPRAESDEDLHSAAHLEPA
jgi:hypothetical protein